MFHCNQCDKVYLRKDSLARHKRIIYGNVPSVKRKHADDELDDEEPYSPLIIGIQAIGMRRKRNRFNVVMVCQSSQ